jgi:TPP-dependent pyruvate/acetoin dehydrogenase alpha subunit
MEVHDMRRFAGDAVHRAPKRTKPTAATTADSVLCYHRSGTAFFALDYTVKRLTAKWVAHKLHIAQHGSRGAHR